MAVLSWLAACGLPVQQCVVHLLRLRKQLPSTLSLWEKTFRYAAQAQGREILLLYAKGVGD